MGVRFRIWMPLVGVAIVLLTVALMLVFGLSVIQNRLSDYAQNRTLTQAAAVAEAASGTGEEELQGALESSARGRGGEVLVVGSGGEVIAREGPRLLEPTPEVRRAAANGDRITERVGDLWVAAVPFVSGGELAGSVVVARDLESSLQQIFLSSWLEAAGIASVLGVGLMLLMATVLSRRVERLAVGADRIGNGELSHRIEPGFGDELGGLAQTLNTTAGRLEDAFNRLEETNAILDAILDNLSEGVLAVDLRLRVVFANPAARSFLGVGEEEDLRELPDAWGDFKLPEAAARCAREGRCGMVRVRSGETFLRVNIESLPRFDEHRGGALIVIQDLSEVHRLEANQQRFLANAAHELRTPITAILGAAELLVTGAEDDPDLRKRFLKHISSEAERMHRLSETLLRLAQAGWDTREPELNPMALDDVARSAAERMRPLAESSGVSIRVAGEGERALADSVQLEQALLIVIGNAVKHSGEDGNVTLQLKGRTIAVQDEGAGISSEDLPYVFERFYRGSRDSEGFGLGLSICRELVEGMGGEISISSREGAGTIVEITLPEVKD